MCIVRARKLGLVERYVAPIFSHHKHGTSWILVPSSFRSVYTDMTLFVSFAKDLYSTSVLDLDTVSCFVALHDIRFGPRNMTKPPLYILSSTQPTSAVKSTNQGRHKLLRSDSCCETIFNLS
jgi:hypothetical protein